MSTADERTDEIVAVLVNAFAPLMAADPVAFRRKFRRMAGDPFAFYRGTACLFYADMARTPIADDPWVDARTSRVWIQGDLHCENFGTYMNSEGVLVFDVNDYDEAYLGHYTWDLRRLAASLALLAFGKAFGDDVIGEMVRTVATHYLDQVRVFRDRPNDERYALTLANTGGVLHDVLVRARLRTRIALLDRDTVIVDADRRFRPGPGVRALDDAERLEVVAAYEDYLGTVPSGKRKDLSSYVVKDVVGRSGFGIGSAGLPAYNLLVEGSTQALENDVVLSMKMGNVAAPSRVVDVPAAATVFDHHGHRTVLSQRALQAHSDPWLGWASVRGQGYVVAELSPYEADLDWDSLSEPADILPVLEFLGRAVAKVHCVSDAGSLTGPERDLVPFPVEEAIAQVIGDRDEAFGEHLVDFALGYARQVREDHRLFVDAFRNDRIPGVASR